MDMCLPGILAYRSILNGNQPIEYPDFRDPAQREKYRNDITCTDPAIASGDDLLPPNSHGVPAPPAENYEKVRRIWEDQLARQAITESGTEK
jgi:hypothetical protein